jgi:formylglycine-generating enzyme required for sulfatase activity
MACLLFCISFSGKAEEIRSDDSIQDCPLDDKFTNELGMTFVLIPPGTFVMGSPLNEIGRDGDERQHKVTLSKPFYLQTTEVTQGQWQSVMGENPSFFHDCGRNCPVEMVSWYDAYRFIDRMNAIAKYPRYRLPTEAEWEYATRSGTQTALSNGIITITGCSYDAGLDRIGWYCGNSGNKTHSVAQKEPNSWGLYDMHGNVWEWCQDWYGDYPSEEVTDPKGSKSGLIRVNRGGSWWWFARFCRSANRIRYMPFDHTQDTGFRLAITAECG